MGTGKSSVSNELSKLSGMEVFSTDQIIEQDQGKSVVKIFDELGESYFRELEAKVIEDITRKNHIILDCGGGAVLNSINIKYLRETCSVFLLTASSEFIYEQVKDKKDRPLLNVENPLAVIQAKLNQRLPLYQQSADYVVSSENRDIKDISKEILKIFNHE